MINHDAMLERATQNLKIGQVSTQISSSTKLELFELHEAWNTLDISAKTMQTHL